MATDSLILDLDSIHSAVEVSYADSIATFFLNSYGTFQIYYGDSILSLVSDVSDFAVLLFAPEGEDPYFVIYTLTGNTINRYKFFIFDEGTFSLYIDFEVAANATSLDLYNISSQQHGISYIDTDEQINYIKFYGDVGVQYYWDKDDDRASNQIEVDDGETVGVYFIDVTENVSVEEYEFQDSYITLAPEEGESLRITAEVDTENAVIDEESAVIYVNDVEVTYIRTDNIFRIQFTDEFAFFGNNTVTITDGTFTYSEVVKLIEKFIGTPKPKPTIRGNRGIVKSKTTSTLIEKFGGRGRYDQLGGPGVRERVRTRIKPTLKK